MSSPKPSIHEAQVPGTKSTRRRDLDALRVFVVIGLVFFHSARVFDTGEFYVKNDPPSESVDAVIAFAVMWGMPLLFVIAGIGIWHSLRSRDLASFAAERTKRLLVPLIFGTLVVVPPQVWHRIRVETGCWPDYLDFYRSFLDVEVNLKGFPFIVRASPATDYFEYGQLWFLVLLFGWSLLLIPFFALLRRRRLVERTIDRYGAWPIATGAVAILALLGVSLPLRPEIALWSKWSCLVLIAYGFAFASDRRLGELLHRARWWILAAAVVGFLTFAGTHIATSDVVGSDPLVDYDADGFVLRTSFAIGGWCWVASILSFTAARRRDSRPREHVDPRPTLWRRFAEMANEAVLPVYVLHQTVIVAIAFAVVSYPIPAGLKYVIVATSSLAVTLMLFRLVRRTQIARFLFGMKASTEASPPSSGLSSTQGAQEHRRS
ncbi:MAG: acyltransferase family protein [bacterium]|nr:acyltransferase family protein [bacterium]